MDNTREQQEEGYEQPEPETTPPQEGGYVDKFNPEEHEVIVRGLSYQATEEDVSEFFTQYGEVKSVKIERYYDGNSKGSCFIKFEEADGVEAACKASGVEFMKRQVWIDKTRPKSERVKEYGGHRRGGNRGGNRGYNNRGYNNRGYNNRGGDRGYNNRGGDRGYNQGGDRGYHQGGDRGYNQGGDRGYNNYDNRVDNRRNDGYNNGGGNRRRGNYNGNRRQGGYRERPQESKIVFVGNLNYRTERDEIWEFFDAVGKVVDVRIARNPSGSKKGFCHIEFETFEDASNAVSCHGKELGGRPLRVDLAAPSRGRRD